MEKDRVIPLFIAVCLFYVSGKLLSLLIRSGPWPYVIAAVASSSSATSCMTTG